jgi:ABC-type glycerol-3-phosphate transport system substrate-binding protein
MRRASLLLAITLVLVGCSLAGGSPVAPGSATADTATIPADAAAGAGDVVTITFGAAESERPIYEPLIVSFNQQNTGIRVQFIALDEFMGAADPAQMLRQVAGAADTAIVVDVRPEDMRGGLVYDLKPLIDADAGAVGEPPLRDDFYPGALDAGSMNGSVYLLPRSLHIPLLSYNKDLWARRGLPAPGPDWTWSDLKAAAEHLAQKRGDMVDVYGLLDWGSGYGSLLAELAASGVDLFATPVGQASLERPEVAAALERVAALARSGALYLKPREPGEPAADDLSKLILDGRAAIWPRDMLFADAGSARPAFAIGTALDPRAQPPFSDVPGGYLMSSGTQHPQEAWRWLAFLSKQPIEPPGAVIDRPSELPARKSVAERSGYWSQLDAETAAAVRAALARPPARSSAAAHTQIFALLNKALNAVVSGKQKPDQALREAQAALDQQIAQGGEPGARPQSEPVVVATPLVEAAAPGAATITFGALAWEAEQIRGAVRAFNQNNPEVFVQLTTIEPTSASFGLAAAAATSDCFMWWHTPKWGEITATLDLQPLLDADAGFDSADYPAVLLAPFRQGNGLYGLPYAVGWRILTYNKQAFDAAGLRYPRADWTMDDFLNAAQKLTTGEGVNKRYGFASISSPAQELLFFLDLFGASATKGSGDTITPNYTDPKVAQAARFYIELLRDYSPNRELQGYKSSIFGVEFFELLNAGRIGMWFGSGNMFLTSPEANKIPLAITAPPLGTGSLSPEDFRSNGLFISAGTQQTAACWRWLKYLSTIPPAADPDVRFPARVSVAMSDAFLKQAPVGASEVYGAYRAALDRAEAERMRAPLDQWRIDLFWFFRAVDRALQGKDLDRELADAQALTEQYLGCIHSGAKPGTCARRVDSSYEGLSQADSSP